MRQISFFHTQAQFRARQKTQTRRLGWASAKPGDVLMGIVKGQGLGKGGKVQRLGPIRLVSVRREPLDAITAEDVIAEGFPGMTPAEFVEFFCGSMRCEPSTIVTRLEFEYAEEHAAHA